MKNSLTIEQGAKYSIKLAKVSFADALEDEGMTGDGDASGALRAVTVTILFDQTLYQKTQQLFYTAKEGASGSAK